MAIPAPRYLAVNADEGEPGTFKDRYYLEQVPHAVPRGHADRRLGGRGGAGLYLPSRRIPRCAGDPAPRDRRASRPRASLPRATSSCAAAPAPTSAARSSAMIESIEGKRGLPRHRPPYVAEVGLFGRPTLVQNVETLFWVARICREGPEVMTRPHPERPHRPAQLFRLRAGGAARGLRAAGRVDHPRPDRRRRRHGCRATPSRPTSPAAPRRASCLPASTPFRSTSTRCSRTAPSSARPPSWCSRTRTARARRRSTCCASSPPRAAASAPPAGSAAPRRCS